jgi:hypothetical protein
MTIRRFLVLLCLLASVLVGCGGPEYSGPRRYPLSGKVTVDGQPLDFGSISFIPADGQRVSGGLIENGTYSVTEENGANAGKYRVEIRWLKLTGTKKRDPDSGEMYDERKEGLPEKYHAQSTLEADVSAKQTTFDFDLKTK